ncbi:MAG: hypothetical protein LBF38_02130 [Deltaproteobacteria bacterium]|jgi:hypothetical protein|nr:hypothetical protein [Deltaproteobacteria bacterium]
MVLGKRNIGHVLKALIIFCVLAVLGGCASGPLEPSRRALEARHRNWIKVIQGALVSDRVYELTDDGSVLPLIVNALPLDDRVLAEARNLWGTDPRFMEKINSWLSKGRIVVLVGLYTRDIHEDDIIKDNRFRLSIRTNNGLKTASKNKELIKQNYIVDYFQVFNPWERVVAFSFDGLWTENPILVLDCPYGTREINLAKRSKS